MINRIDTGFLIMGLLMFASASASPVSWNTDSDSAACTSGVGNSCIFTESGYTLTARAYSTARNSRSDVFEKATLISWGSGLGVRNPDQINEILSPNHALDDSGRRELIIFESNYPGNAFTGFEIGWRRNDSDISAWVGSRISGYDFTGVRFSDLAGLGFIKNNFSNVPVDTQRLLRPGRFDGNYLILAPKHDSNAEYIKISRINGDIPNQIPQPGILALFVASGLGLWVSRRRNIC
ncbi:PEP-CTERM protein-sorting domain-containing protein [Nitrosomonas marina]|uniref:PEP-CTERM protein-sorting domain-containing protein n=1 Tax=Nitrosomonas marina TaxID=917 RepID=A0A1I0DPC9_9PROT|nr:hypothetical protein [Nitrosomonas marina]SET33578.1 PEP-CTERM protein-sorting domain-containing protein [Nitrosomonas marina]